MKKKIVAIMACAMMLLSVGASAEMTAGTYTGEGQGIGGAVKVAVTVEGGAITAVEVVEHAETAGICDPAIEKIPAAIVAAQSLAVDTVTGATVTSKAILAAAEQALTEAGADIEALKTAAPKAEQAEGETIEMTTDVVVVGAGGAGVAAAVEANDNGASVVLLEKLTQIGGTTATSQGMVGGYETKYTKALDVHYTFEEMYGNLMSNASYRLDPALTTITVERSGETIDWMGERLGMPFSDNVIVGYGPLQMMHLVDGAGPAMRTAMEDTLAGTGVELLLETEGTEILMNEDGSVKGVKAVRGADTLLIYADSVIITTGGYAYNPELTVRLEVREQAAYVHAQAVEAAGGMPVGCNGAAVTMLSGGIDSPVSSYMIAKRGVRLIPVHFFSFPYTSELAKEKVISLAKELTAYTGRMTLQIVPFTHIQEEIRRACPEEYFTLIMRRFMMRIAEDIAAHNECKAIVTGENLGQVASQTMEAMACTQAVTNLPVLQPLIGMDKRDIVKIARDIGTFDTSILPYEDCCTVFTPRHPKTRPTVAEVAEAESALDIDALVREAVDGIERIRIDL